MRANSLNGRTNALQAFNMGSIPVWPFKFVLIAQLVEVLVLEAGG